MLKIRLRAVKGTKGTGIVFFMAGGATHFSPEQSVSFAFDTSGEYQDIYIPLYKNTAYRGNVTSLRIDVDGNEGIEEFTRPEDNPLNMTDEEADADTAKLLEEIKEKAGGNGLESDKFKDLDNTGVVVAGGGQVDTNAGSTNNNPSQINPDGSPVLPDSETDNNSDSLDNWLPNPGEATDKTSDQNIPTPVEDEQNQDQQVSNPNPQGDKSQEEFLKELAAQLGAQYTPDGEGSSADHIVDPETSGSNTDHDYSGITINGN